jgi:hypothetical protein
MKAAVIMLAWGVAGVFIPMPDRVWFAVLFAIPFVVDRQ